MKPTKQELIKKYRSIVLSYETLEKTGNIETGAVTENVNFDEIEAVISEAYDAGVSAGKGESLQEVLKLVQEDIDFGASKQQIVQTKAQSYILTQLRLLSAEHSSQ